jgi:hypothetical protein
MNPPPNPHNAAAAIAVRSLWPASDPKRTDSAIPTAAKSITAARLL